jgi:hypothetical protein
MRTQPPYLYFRLALVGLSLLFSSLHGCGYVNDPQNLIVNGSFEDDGGEWSIDRESTIVLLNESPQFFILKNNHLDEGMKFRFFPIRGAYFANAPEINIAAKISVIDEKGLPIKDENGRPILRNLMPAIYMGKDRLSQRDALGRSYREIALEEIIPADVLKLLYKNPLLNFLGFSSQVLRVSVQLTPHNGHMEVVGETFNRIFTPVEVFFHEEMTPVDFLGNVSRLDSLEEIIDFRRVKKNNWSNTKRFDYLPLDGNQLIKVDSWKTSYATQKVSGLEPGKDYLLMVGQRNVMGPVPPTAQIIGEGGKVLKRMVVPLPFAQEGWTYSLILFRPQHKSTMVRLGSGSMKFYEKNPLYKPRHRYANLYDDVRLYKIPEGDTTEFYRYLETHFNILPVDISRGFKVEDYKKNMPEGFRKALYREHESYGIPVLDLFYDEVTFWNNQLLLFYREEPSLWHKSGEKLKAEDYHNAIRFPRRSKKMLPAELKIDGQRTPPVKIRNRGIHSAHFASRNKSLKIGRSKKDRMYLLNPQSRSFISEPFSYFVSRQLGGMGMRSDFVFLRTNNKPIGVSWRYWKDHADIELSRRPDGSLLESVEGTYHLNRTEDEWKTAVRPQNKIMRKTYPGPKVLALFMAFLREGLVDFAGGLANVERFLAWNAHSIIVDSAHQEATHNAFLYLNSADGRLEPIPIDINMGVYHTLEAGDNVRHYNPIMDKFLAKFEFFNQRDRILWEYVSDDKKIEQALEYYDDLYKKNSNAFINAVLMGVGSEAPLSLDRTKAWLLGGKGIFLNRVKKMKELFGKNNQVVININEFREAERVRSKVNQVFEIKINPKNNSAWSSSLVESLSITLNDVNARLKIFPETAEKKEENRVTFPLQDFIPSDKYFMYQVSYLWEHEYSLVLEKLEKSPALQEIIRSNYNKSGAGGYALAATAFKDAKLIKSLLTTFAATGKINASREKRYFIQYEGAFPLVPSSDFSFSVKNGVTQVPNNPEIKVSVKVGKAKDFPKPTENQAQPVKTNNDTRILSRILKDQPIYSDYRKIYLSIDEFLEKNSQFSRGASQNMVTLNAGVHEFPEMIILPKELTLYIQPGAELRFGPEASLISYGKVMAVGTKDSPIIFHGYEDASEWGVIGLLHEKATGVFENCVFRGGGEAHVNGAYFSGMLAAHYAQLIVRNSIFLEAGIKGGDDAINVKYGKASISDSYFYRNRGDAIDFDFAKPGSQISNSYFLENGNDGIDISGSEVVLYNILVSKSGDKGISLGEETHAVMNDIRVQGSKIGLASKDSSRAILSHSVFIDNFIGAAAYRKKSLFEGGTIHASNTLFEKNKFDFGVQVCSVKEKGTQQDCSSEISTENSKFRIRNRTFETMIKAPRKRITSKKKYLIAAWSGSLSDYGYKHVRLNDYKINRIVPPLGAIKKLGPRHPFDVPGLMARLPVLNTP